MGPKSREVGAVFEGATKILDGTELVVKVFVPVGSIVCGPVVG